MLVGHAPSVADLYRESSYGQTTLDPNDVTVGEYEATTDPATWGSGVAADFNAQFVGDPRYRFIVYMLPDSWNEGGR